MMGFNAWKAQEKAGASCQKHALMAAGVVPNWFEYSTAGSWRNWTSECLKNRQGLHTRRRRIYENTLLKA